MSLSRSMWAIAQRGTLRAPAEASCRNQHPGLHREEQGHSSYACTKKSDKDFFLVGNVAWLWVRLAVLGQNQEIMLEIMLRVFQHMGTFAPVTATCSPAALMPCSGHPSVFRGTGTVGKV